jgi:hypothetical protein
MAKQIWNDSSLPGWETKKLFWDYLGYESITRKSTGKKELYTGELQQWKKYWMKKNNSTNQ